MHRKAFTLIELLVVISIISLLSGIVLASINSAREKARVAAGEQFEANVYHVAADSALGIWDFDECSGGTAKDRSGNGNDAPLSGSPVPSWSSSDTPGGGGCSLVLNGSNWVSITGLTSSAQSYTYSMWVKSTMVSSLKYLIDFESGRLVFGWNTGTTGKIGYYNNGVWRDMTNAPADGKWHHLALVLSSAAGKGSLYIDGALAGSGPYVAAVLGGNASIFASYSGTANIAGSVDGVRIYAKDLTAGEIRALYASGASRTGRLADSRI